MSFTYEQAMGAPQGDAAPVAPQAEASQEVVRAIEVAAPGFSVIGGFLWGALVGAIAAGKGDRGRGALWGGGANALFSPIGYYAHRFLGPFGYAISFVGSLAVPIYFSRYGVGKAEWPPWRR